MQQGVQTDATCNIYQCWELLANNVASVCTGLYKCNLQVELLFSAPKTIATLVNYTCT